MCLPGRGRHNFVFRNKEDKHNPQSFSIVTKGQDKTIMTPTKGGGGHIDSNKGGVQDSLVSDTQG